MICRKCRKELVDGDQVTKITFESGAQRACRWGSGDQDHF